MLSPVEAFLGFFSRIYFEDKQAASPRLDSRQREILHWKLCSEQE